MQRTRRKQFQGFWRLLPRLVIQVTTSDSGDDQGIEVRLFMYRFVRY